MGMCKIIQSLAYTVTMLKLDTFSSTISLKCTWASFFKIQELQTDLKVPFTIELC